MAESTGNEEDAQALPTFASTLSINFRTPPAYRTQPEGHAKKTLG